MGCCKTYLQQPVYFIDPASHVQLYNNVCPYLIVFLIIELTVTASISFNKSKGTKGITHMERALIKPVPET